MAPPLSVREPYREEPPPREWPPTGSVRGRRCRRVGRTSRQCSTEPPRSSRPPLKRESLVAKGRTTRGGPQQEDAQPDRLVGKSPIIDAEFEGAHVRCLLDTGSEVTTMPYEFFGTYFAHLAKSESGGMMKLKAANHTVIPVAGIVWLNVRVCGQDLGKRGILLVESSMQPGVPVTLGMNVLQDLDRLLSQRQGPGYWKRVTSHRPAQQVFQRLITTRGVRESFPEGRSLGKVYAPRRPAHVVPPRQEKIMYLPVEGRRRLNGLDVLIEPRRTARKGSDLLVARSIGTVIDGRVAVRCVNLHDRAVFFRPGAPVADVFLYQEEADLGQRVSLRAVEAEPGTYTVSTRAEDSPTPEWNGKVILEQMKIDKTQFTEEQLTQVEAVLWEFQAAFSRHEDDFGCTTVIQHQIPTGTTAPIRERYRQIPPAMYQEVKTMLAQMLKSGVVRESQSPWAAPVVLVRKKDGSLRFCVDYRKLNAATTRDAFPLPRIEESLTALRRTKYFSTLDLASGYWQVPMAPEDRQKTAFILPMGLFEFDRMPFGLTNAPGTFQRLMEHCLGEMNFESILIYLDDIIIHAASFEEHLRRLRQVLCRLQSHGLKLKPKKCHLFQTSIEYLGHVVSAEGILPSEDKVKVVRDWPTPRTLRELRAFLGLAGYYRRFIKDFAKIAGPLHELLQGTSGGPKTRPLPWSPRAQQAFDTLKLALISAPILAYARYDLPFILYTDGSLHGLGAVLSQVQDGQERVIAYASRALRESERNPINYSSFKLELLALVWAMTEKFAGYLTGAEVQVKTDNNPLAHLQNAKLGALEQRWVARMARYRYTIQYRAGKENGNADALSRVTPRTSALETDEVEEDIEIPDLSKVRSSRGIPREDEVTDATGSPARDRDWSEVMTTCGIRLQNSVLLGKTRADWVRTQGADPDLCQLRWWLEREEWPTIDQRSRLSPAGWKLMQEWDRLEVKDGVLYRQVWLPHAGSRWQLVVPEYIARQVARESHEKGAHFGAKKTYQWVQQFVYCPQLERIVREECQKCRSCEVSKPPEQRAPVQTIHTSAPLELLLIDYIQIAPAGGGYRYCLVMVDHFSKFAVAVATKDQTAESAAQAICRHFIQIYGCPKRIHSDQGACFQGKLMAELYRLYGIERSRTTPYHPQGNGACERFNRTLLQMLRTLEVEKRTSWPDYLPELMWAYNNRVHKTTGYAPYTLLFGRPSQEIAAVNLVPSEPDEARTHELWMQMHRRNLLLVQQIVQEKTASIEHASQLPVQTEPLVEGTKVLVRSKRPADKLDDRWETEPYVVKRRVHEGGPVYDVIRESGLGPLRRLHRNMLRPCHSESDNGVRGVEPPSESRQELGSRDEEWWRVPLPPSTGEVTILPPRDRELSPKDEQWWRNPSLPEENDTDDCQPQGMVLTGESGDEERVQPREQRVDDQEDLEKSMDPAPAEDVSVPQSPVLGPEVSEELMPTVEVMDVRRSERSTAGIPPQRYHDQY